MTAQWTPFWGTKKKKIRYQILSKIDHLVETFPTFRGKQKQRTFSTLISEIRRGKDVCFFFVFSVFCFFTCLLRRTDSLLQMWSQCHHWGLGRKMTTTLHKSNIKKPAIRQRQILGLDRENGNTYFYLRGGFTVENDGTTSNSRAEFLTLYGRKR